MSEANLAPAEAGTGNLMAEIARRIPALARHAIRLPVLMLLVVLEPIVCFACAGLALLGILTTVFFRLVDPVHFPTWTMFFLSAGFVCVLVAYEALIRVFSD